MAVYRFIAPIKNVAPPLADEHALRRATLIAGVIIDRAGALCRPAHDLDAASIWIVNKAAISL